MHVAMILGSFPELSQRFLMNQIAGLLDAGIDLDIYAAMESAGGKRHALDERYGLRERTNYARVPRSGLARLRELPRLLGYCLSLNPKKTARALSRRYATASRNLKTLYFLRSFAHRRYDLIHCHFGPNGLVGAYLKDVGIAKRLVVSFHGSDINSYPRRHGEKVYRTLFERADLITANTAFTSGKLVANGCRRDIIEILPMGLRMDEYPESPFDSRSVMRILTVGRLVEKKGYRYSIEAFAAVKRQYPEAEYLVAGDGPELPDLQRLAARLGVAESVRFLGAQSDGEVAALYRSAAVFVLPSVTASDGDMEGQGLVLQEAQGCALPVVSTLHNGIPEGVRDGETGFLVAERDPGALAAAISRLLANSALRERMGRAGRAFVSAAYDTPVLTKRLIELYERIAS